MNIDILMWAKSTGFHLSIAIFIFGVIVKILQILILGRKKDLSEPRNQNLFLGGMGTVFKRFLPMEGSFQSIAMVFIPGYIFHIGFFLVLFFYIPHIQIFKSIFGFGWPGLPTPILDAITILSMIALVVILVNRLTDPVRKYLSDFHDYLIWLLTFLPFITGYMAYRHLFLEYTLMLGIHILSAELLIALLPFTRLSHSVTLFFARWYTGAMAWRKGVKV